MTKTRLFGAIALLAAGLSWLTPAHAVPVTWNLSGVTFADGGIASGAFTYDADLDAVTSWAITTSGGDVATFPSPFTYSSTLVNHGVNVMALSSVDGQAFLFDPDITSGFFGRQLRLDPIALLTNAGGTILLDVANTSGNTECFNCLPFRLITAGQVTTAAVVPEPGTLALFVFGLAGLGVAIRRRATRTPLST